MTLNGETPSGVEIPTDSASADQQQKVVPSRPLPSNRIAFPKQLDIIRAFATISGPSQRAVSTKEVASLVKMHQVTVSTANPFLCDIGLIHKADGNKFALSNSVYDFARAYSWNQATSAHKLAPLMQNSWFGQILLSRLEFSRNMPQQEAIELLASHIGATPEYARQIQFLLEYLQASGLIKIEGDNIISEQHWARPETPTNGKQAQDGVSDMSPEPNNSHHSVATAFTQAPEGQVQFHVSIRVDMAEIATWRPDRITAFFNGLAQVLAAKGMVEKESSIN